MQNDGGRGHGVGSDGVGQEESNGRVLTEIVGPTDVLFGARDFRVRGSSRDWYLAEWGYVSKRIA